jgi:hypothetical protein
MSFYIYGIRIAGDTECRYVGMTSKQPEDRLYAHSREAIARVARKWIALDPECFQQWLADNHSNVEAFKIAKVDTKAEALATEKAIVALCLRLNHRLFNHWLVPADKRIAWKPSPYRKRKVAAQC